MKDVDVGVLPLLYLPTAVLLVVLWASERRYVMRDRTRRVFGIFASVLAAGCLIAAAAHLFTTPRIAPFTLLLAGLNGMAAFGYGIERADLVRWSKNIRQGRWRRRRFGRRRR